MNQCVFTVIKKELKEIKAVLYNGDNYVPEWEKEATKRGLPNDKTTPIALKALITKKALEMFDKYRVLSNVELKSRYLIHLERYIKDLEIEAKCLDNICLSQVIPAATAYQKGLVNAIVGTREALGKEADLSAQQDLLKRVTELVNKIYGTNKDIMAKIAAASSVHDEQKKAEMLCSKVKPKMNELRDYVDELEGLVDDELWPLPKFWEMLFIN